MTAAEITRWLFWHDIWPQIVAFVHYKALFVADWFPGELHVCHGHHLTHCPRVIY